MTARDDWLVSGIGHCTAEQITVCGRDLAQDLMGTVSFPDLAFLLVTRRLPTAAESRLLNAVLVALTDHGLTPTVLAARLTYTGAPEALQGAIAAGLLGGGSVFLGPTEDTARFLHTVGTEHRLSGDCPVTALRSAADQAVQACRAAGRRVPGLGHPVHKEVDPRVPRLYTLAAEAGLLGMHLRLLEQVQIAQVELSGRRLPINGAGAAGAALADLGLPPELARGFALLARTAGLIGHLAEEMDHPLGMSLYRDIEDRMHYRPSP
ncbi:MAG TPA: citryl-CoA lyase [Pseudonocardiaceae bacterium]|nr:citryl-CoA lyase [Pseudonocardiaceae bacterium]